MSSESSRQASVEVIVQVGVDASVQTIVEAGVPTLEVDGGSVTLLLTPQATFARRPIAAGDVDWARDLSHAAAAYLAAMRDLWAAQQGDGAPTVGPANE